MKTPAERAAERLFNAPHRHFGHTDAEWKDAVTAIITAEYASIEKENRRLEQLVCDFQAAGQIDVGGMNGPCCVEPRHIEQHVAELRQENQRLREALIRINNTCDNLLIHHIAQQALATDKEPKP